MRTDSATALLLFVFSLFLLLLLFLQLNPLFTINLPHCFLAHIKILLHLSLPFNSLSSQFSKCLFHVQIILCWGFHKCHFAILLAICFCLSSLNHSIFFFKIELIADDHKWECFRWCDHTFLQETIFPIRNIFKGPIVCNIINEECTICSSVKSCAERLVPFLPSRIPNLESHYLIIYCYFLVRKVCSNCRFEVFSESTVLEHLNKTSLTNTRVTYSNYFHETLLLWTNCLHSLHIIWSNFVFFPRVCWCLRRRILERVGFWLSLRLLLVHSYFCSVRLVYHWIKL